MYEIISMIKLTDALRKQGMIAGISDSGDETYRDHAIHAWGNYYAWAYIPKYSSQPMSIEEQNELTPSKGG